MMMMEEENIHDSHPTAGKAFDERWGGIVAKAQA
jgi:hypothetical protein